MYMVKERKSNIELLRIICILMIILLHYNNARMGGALTGVEKYSFNYYLVNFVESLCIVAVNVFVIITGYFSYEKEKVKISKVIKLFYQCAIYGLLIYFILVGIGRLEINSDTLYSLRDTIFDRWFIIIYSILYLLIPYINKVLNKLDKKQFIVLLSICFLFFYIWPTFYIKTPLQDRGYGIVNFIVLYIIGAYIHKYRDNKIKIYIPALIYILCAVITTYFVCYTKLPAFDYNQVFNLIGAISLFLVFKNIDIKDNKIINKLSTYVLCTYIIHENSFFRTILYKEIFLTPKFYHRKLIMLNMFYTTLGIFFGCVIIECIRRLIMKKIDNSIDKIKYEIE